MDDKTIRALDGHALTHLAFQLGLAPSNVMLDRDGDLCFAREGLGGVRFATVAVWSPHSNLATADQVFRHLRTLGWTTSCLWKNDDRQYGDAWVCLAGRAISVQWPHEVASEAHALLLCSVLAIASMQETPDGP